MVLAAKFGVCLRNSRLCRRLRSLCRTPALSVSGPGNLCALSVSGPGAVCVGPRRSVSAPALSVPGALCVAPRHFLCRYRCCASGPSAARCSLCRARRFLYRPQRFRPRRSLALYSGPGAFCAGLVWSRPPAQTACAGATTPMCGRLAWRCHPSGPRKGVTAAQLGAAPPIRHRATHPLCGPLARAERQTRLRGVCACNK